MPGVAPQKSMNQNKPVLAVAETPQPTPTGGSLSMINQANTSATYFSGGGGGGPSTIGPNPVVSTLTTNGTQSILNPDIQGAASTFIIYCPNAVASAIVGANFGAGGNIAGIPAFEVRSQLTNPDNSDMSLFISTQQTYFNNLVPNGTFLEIQSDATAGLSTCGSLELGALPDGRSYVGAALGYSPSSLSTLMLLGDGVNISSLNVSSINGAAPGGSVPANLELSSLTMGLPGVITGVSSLVGGGGILSVGDQLAVSSITGLGGALLLDGQGQAINVAGSAVNVPAAPVNISTATISSINGLAPGAVPNPLSVSSIIGVSSINNSAVAIPGFSGFYTTYNQGGGACSLGTTYWSLVNNVGQLQITAPETPGANWAGGTKFFIFGNSFGGGTQSMPSSWYFDNVNITCPDGTGSYTLTNWKSESGGNQLTLYTTLGGTPSTFSITAQVRAV